MAKTKLLQSTRDSLLSWMTDQLQKKLQKELEKPEAKAIEVINKAIRVKYPEKDMEVLRKYKCTGRDSCLKFVNDTGQVFGVDFGYEERSRTRLADLPSTGGCTRNDVFPVSAATQNAIEAFIKKRESNQQELNKKRSEYHAFLAACKSVEEFNDVVPLPDDLKKRYLGGGALIAINPDVIASIKSDFKKAA